MVFYACPVCGRYELGFSMINRGLNKNQLASSLLYNGYRASDFEYVHSCYFRFCNLRNLFYLISRGYEVHIKLREALEQLVKTA